MKKIILIATALIILLTVTSLANPGDTIWTRTYGGSEDDGAYSVQQTTHGGYIIAGCTYSYGAREPDWYIIKTDVDGDTIWTRMFGGRDYDEATSVQQTADGGYIIVGNTESIGEGESDICIVKIDASGDTLWTRVYGGGQDDWAYSVQQTADGGYIVAGATESFGAGRSDVLLLKIEGEATAVDEYPPPLPATTTLFQSYPNPFNARL